MVFYRKYRPQTIEELDSTQVREALTSILSKNDPPHALLFTGPKGLGKTSSARIVAKVVNCTAASKKRKNGFEPCGECESCVSIGNGTNMDILEIDAASNRGIDEIRDLKEKIKLSPLSSKMKVYIIDEVHMLTSEAFNALLKTLEEPPEHAIFILCTTEQQKVPPTIFSRCFNIAFKKATEEELVRSFLRIIKGEKINADKEVLKYIAKLSDGAFRDGAKILEEMSMASGKKEITQKLIEEKYKVISLNKTVEDMIFLISENNYKKALNLISDITEGGIDIKYFTQSLIENIHDRILDELNSGNMDAILNYKNMAQSLSKAYQDMKYSVIPQLPLELAIIELCTLEHVKEEVALNLNSTEGVSVASLRTKIGNIKKIKAMYGAKDSSDNKKVKEEKDDSKRVTLLQASNNANSKEWLDHFWLNLISEMKKYNHTVAGVLRGCRISGFDKKQLVIETNFKFHKERLNDLKTISELSRVAKLLTGRDVAVIVELKNSA